MTTALRRRSTTTIMLPPTESSIFNRGIMATVLAAQLIIRSGVDFEDVFSLRHPSPSWLIQYFTSDCYAAVRAVDPAGHYDFDGATNASLKVHWILRVLVTCFILGACYAQFSLSAKRRAVPIILGWGPRRAIYRERGGRQTGSRPGGLIIGHWRPDFFWPMAIMEVALLLLPLLYPESMGYLESSFYIATCVALIFLGLTTTKNFGDGPDGTWDGDGSGEDWKFNFLRQVFVTVWRFITGNTWDPPRKVRARHTRSRWE